MKKITFFLTTMLVAMTTLVSCAKQEEEVKMIPADAVKMSGMHKDLLKITSDSIKIMLVKVDKEWQVRAIIPFGNTTLFSEVPETDQSANSYYLPSMGNMNISYTDQNGNTLDYVANPDWGMIEGLLKSAPGQMEEMQFGNGWGDGSGSYKEMKAVFDKVSGLLVSNMELTRGWSASGGRSSDSDDDLFDDDDLDDLEKAVKAEKKMLKAAKTASDVIDAYEDALDAWDDL